MNNKKFITTFKGIAMVIALLFFQIPLWGQAPIQKSNLKILYVGGSTDFGRSSERGDTTGLAKGAQERMASFERMLKEYFNSVRVIHANNYTQELSNDYDVTVMDGLPVPITPRVNEGGIYKPAAYLTEDFDRPMLFIGELGENLGRSIGLKTDWY